MLARIFEDFEECVSFVCLGMEQRTSGRGSSPGSSKKKEGTGTAVKLPMLKDLYLITDVAQAQAHLKAARQQEIQIHSDLEKMLNNSDEVETSLATVEEIPYMIIHISSPPASL